MNTESTPSEGVANDTRMQFHMGGQAGIGPGQLRPATMRSTTCDISSELYTSSELGDIGIIEGQLRDQPLKQSGKLECIGKMQLNDHTIHYQRLPAAGLTMHERQLLNAALNDYDSYTNGMCESNTAASPGSTLSQEGGETQPTFDQTTFCSTTFINCADGMPCSKTFIEPIQHINCNQDIGYNAMALIYQEECIKPAVMNMHITDGMMNATDRKYMYTVLTALAIVLYMENKSLMELQSAGKVSRDYMGGTVLSKLETERGKIVKNVVKIIAFLERGAIQQ